LTIESDRPTDPALAVYTATSPTEASHQSPTGGPVAPRVAVVIPAFRVAPYIAEVVARIPPSVHFVVVVDDASPDDLQNVLAGLDDPRLISVRH
jgi:hypothetical protein